MRALVCGSRDWNDYKLVKITLTGLLHCYNSLVIIEGCARGADAMAERFAEEHGITPMHFPAAWRDHGDGSWCVFRCQGSRTCYGAGPRRNQQMLDEGQPDVVIAFKNDLQTGFGRGGTEDMVQRAAAQGIPVMHIQRIGISQQRLMNA